MKKNLILCGIFIFAFHTFASENAIEILKKIDETRGPSYNTYQATIDVITTENEKITEENRLTVLIKNNIESVSSIAFIETPEIQKGRRMLMVGNDTWLYVPGSKKPIKISAAQKLSGNASTGDILSVNYSQDYTPSIIGDEKIGDIDCMLVELIAAKQNVNYYKIVLYVTKKDYKPVKALYYTKSLKLLKTGYFRKYSNINGRPICVETVIVDGIMNNKITIIKHLGFKESNAPDSYFNKDFIKDITL